MVRVSFFSQIRHRNALTEIAWEDAIQGLGGNVYRSVIEKQGIVGGIVVYRQRVYKQGHLWELFHEYFEGTTS